MDEKKSKKIKKKKNKDLDAFNELFDISISKKLENNDFIIEFKISRKTKKTPPIDDK